MSGKTYEGKLIGEGLKVSLVVSRFNELVSGRLLSGARDALERHGVAGDAIETAWVPGAFVIPLVAKRLAESGKYDAVVCLGAVIRGQTPHFDYVAGESAKGIAQISLASGVPVIYGIVTTDTLEQAIERAGLRAGNRGGDAATAAIEMANLLRELP